MNRLISLVVIVVGLIGCTHPRHILRNDGVTMRDLIVDGQRVDSRTSQPRGSDALRRESKPTRSVESYTRNSLNEIDQLFPTLPNPEIAIYIFPHLATKDRVPVPGYTTSIYLYTADEYALPGESKAQ